MSDPSAPPSPTEPHRQQSRFTPESVASALALLISIFALAVSLFEANTQRVQQRASVWPFVELTQRFNAEGYSIEVVNKGVGPALIRTIELSLDGAQVPGIDAMIEAAIGEEQAFSYERYSSTDPTGGVMSPGERIQLFGVGWDAQTRMMASEFAERGGISACYCSIFDDCWRVEMGPGDQTEPVEQCQAD